jgi:hypothetical protein
VHDFLFCWWEKSVIEEVDARDEKVSCIAGMALKWRTVDES